MPGSTPESSLGIAPALKAELGYGTLVVWSMMRKCVRLDLALKSAGLDSKNITIEQMKVILERVFPGEHANRGVEDPKGVCRILIRGLSEVAAETSGETPEDVFSRLGGS